MPIVARRKCGIQRSAHNREMVVRRLRAHRKRQRQRAIPRQTLTQSYAIERRANLRLMPYYGYDRRGSASNY